jgi:hypothetical protein
MKDQRHYAGRFSAEVDRILEQHGRAEEQGPEPEYPALLDLAEQLAAIDPSQHSSLRPRLRAELLDQLNAKIVARQRPLWRRLLPLPAPRRALCTLAVLTVLMTLAWLTPTGQAVAQNVGRLIRELRWSHTTVHQLSPGAQPTATAIYQEQAPAHSGNEQYCGFVFQGHHFDFYYPADVPVRNETVTLAQAIAEAGFDVRIPSFVPDGYTLSQVHLLCVAPYDVFMIYENQGEQLGLYQSFVRPTGASDAAERRGIGIFTSQTLQDVLVGDSQAVLINDASLVWEQDDISFHLIGSGLGGDVLLRIAESLVLGSGD